MTSTSKTAKNPTHTTPRGIASYPYLVKPDTKFDADGIYKITLLLDQDAVGPMVDTAESVLSAFREKQIKDNPKQKNFGVHTPFDVDLDDNGDPTGLTAVKFKQKAVIQGRDGEPISKTVALFDAKGNRLTDVNPYGGSEVKVAYVIIPYTNASDKVHGVTFRLVAVQVITLVDGGERDAEGYGFGEEEGYVAGAAEDIDPFDSNGAEAGDDDGEAPVAPDAAEGSNSTDF